MNEALTPLAEKLLAMRGGPACLVLYPHTGIDGDALGSSLALLIALRSAGLDVRLPLDEAVPARLTFLPALEMIEFVDSQAIEHVPVSPSVALLIDCADPGRLGQRRILSDQASACLVLDHHVTAAPLADLAVIDTGAAAVAELAFELITILEARLGTRLRTHEVDQLLMTALISDTGGFSFSNTTARSFRSAAELMTGGIDLSQISYELFYRSSAARLRLMGSIYSQARFYRDNKIVMASVDQEILHQFGAGNEDLDGIITQLRHVSGVELAIVLRQQTDGVIRANIRSGPAVHAARFAAVFGGGGHPRAAGMTLTDMTLPDAEASILREAAAWL